MRQQNKNVVRRASSIVNYFSCSSIKSSKYFLISACHSKCINWFCLFRRLTERQFTKIAQTQEIEINLEILIKNRYSLRKYCSVRSQTATNTFNSMKEILWKENDDSSHLLSIAALGSRQIDIISTLIYWLPNDQLEASPFQLIIIIQFLLSSILKFVNCYELKLSFNGTHSAGHAVTWSCGQTAATAANAPQTRRHIRINK